MATVASLSGLRVGLSVCSLSQCTPRNNRLMPGSLPLYSHCILPNHRSRALHGVARASSMEANAAGATTESESEQMARRMANIKKDQEIKARTARQKSLFEAETELHFLEAQLKVSVPVTLVTVTGFAIRYLVAGMPASVQSPHADWVFIVILFFATLYLRPFFQYPGAKQKWSRLNKAVEDDLQQAAKELN